MIKAETAEIHLIYEAFYLHFCKHYNKLNRLNWMFFYRANV